MANGRVRPGAKASAGGGTALVDGIEFRSTPSQNTNKNERSNTR